MIWRTWEEWFQKFDEKQLAFLYQEETREGEESRFFKLVSRETAEASKDASACERRHRRDGMPYRTIEELPESVREHLPRHAQEIYRAAFNHAWEEYGHDEERAHRVAWGAVKRQYVKDERTGEWKRK